MLSYDVSLHPDCLYTMSIAEKNSNFLEQIIEKDLEEGRVCSIHTRFPPEPNGFLHIGHAKSVCLNFGLAEKFQGQCNLRFDDTNPAKEEQVYVNAIKEDIQWLGFQWAGDIHYASDYFDTFYQWAQQLIKDGKAYVCDLSPAEAKAYRGWATTPGKESPYRDRSVQENLDLLERMKQGEFEEGSKTLRARMDMASPNMNLRDPILYRIRRQSHHQTGNKWCIYPSYDFAHGQEDAIEGITHSICTLEFQDHRPLYDWFMDNLPVPHRSRQYEFGRLNLNYTVTSKRKLKQLVDEKSVDGWDDPRMPTLSGMRRRGYTPDAIKQFCDMIGVTKSDGIVDVAMLEHALRNDLNEKAARAMAILDPLKVVITNLPEGHRETIDAPIHPNYPERGTRALSLTREIYIDRNDFTEDTSLSRKKFKRLVLSEWVRLRNAYVIKADEVCRNDEGVITEVRVSLVPDTLGSNPPEGIRPRGVVHWVSATEGMCAELRLYDRLFTEEAPDRDGRDFMDCLNKDSLVIRQGWIEKGLASAKPEQHFQFEREGYYVTDRYDHSAEHPVFNLTIGLKDTWAKKA
ncbi:Glutamine--tRNA ligase [invertebrate metagenome]|uniref:Glutamine--tRNA ligase n=1 Tax=invertebrate metagenome TaxID=1711999 RepID=A0A2H9T5W0_9ZZZZ